ncbi:hypothetical protein MHM84_03555 [Halomonas sp. McH1-25]|uniref:hypothetical protein n=1 Tax=unclassified Halomonas TaxID=2609666 RepID=UPI001EF4F3EA|nr:MULTISPECIES: hypothetical protein [unclassified Halomonas]MCG7598848.1 hypothetical protein [Halomonas sp. McH1-25]MCP1340811.1 hypothetical protein [Halomonas sp. FL8]MCP1361306.1 hypothetical protein [Halomonas sp. BBD45]MCP1364337.1 hypothetical protein [Halomonas sp. BBD48]
MKGPIWTREELDFLAAHYGQPGWDSKRIQVEKPGPHRSLRAITSKAGYLRLAKKENTGRWVYPAYVYDDLYDLAIMDYSSQEIAAHIKAQHGFGVSPTWVVRTMRKRLPTGVYHAWAKRANERRSRSAVKAWRGRNAA